MFRLTVGTVVAINVRGLVLLYANTAVRREGRREGMMNNQYVYTCIRVQAVDLHYQYM